MRLRVSPNGRYFVTQDGRPWFYLGDTAWLIFQRLDPAQTEEYLQDRASKGFTVLQSYVIRGLGRQHPDGPTNLLGEVPFVDRDPTRPNEGFFRRVDEVVRRANELGLVMALVVAKSWHVDEHAEHIFDPENGLAFGKFLGARYKRDAVIWYVGGDAAPRGPAEQIWVAMARGLREGSEGQHLVSYHGHGHTSSSYWFHEADWLDFNSIQSGHRYATDTAAFITHDYELSPPKPTVDMEPPYENHPTGPDTPRIDSHQVRKDAYRAMLAGAAGHGYGALDLFRLYQEDEGPFPRDGFLPWRQAVAYEGSRQVGLMRRLFELRPWHQLVPDQTAVVSGLGEGDTRVQAARAEDGSFLIAYLAHGNPVGVRLGCLSGPEVQARWYDPRGGTWRDIGRFPNSGTQVFTAPSQGEKEDWVLVLEEAAKRLPLELP